MTSLFSRTRFFAVAVVAGAAVSATASAQTTWTFVGGSGTTELQQTGWTTGSNWVPVGVPTGTDVWAQVNSGSWATMRIAYSSASVGTTGTLTVGAISMQPTLSSTSGALTIQNSSTTTQGTLRFFGIDNVTLDGVPRRAILVNSSTLTNVSFSTTNGQTFELHGSGAVHVADGTRLTLSPRIRDGIGSQSITKTGPGLLAFSGTFSEQSTYSGGFVLANGMVQYSDSGGSSASPFGTGTLTIRSGTIRSSSANGRSITNNILLDGTVTLGSTIAGTNGSITVNSASGTRSTTVASDSVISIVAGGSTAWNQSVSGAGSITKAGAGLLRFTPFSTLTHSGSTIVQEGSLIMAGNLSSSGAVTVLSGASLFGTGTIAGATSILAGGTFSPGTTSGATGLFTFGSGGLTLGGQTVMELTGTSRGVDYDAVNLGGVLNYGGVMSLSISGTYGDLAELKLFDFAAGAAGDFSSITASGVYGSVTLTNDGFGVWSSEPTIIAGQTLRFTQSTGVLAFVPEPSAIALAGLGAAAAAAWTRRRCRRRFTQAA